VTGTNVLSVGLIGLGIMGTAYAGNLRRRGFEVYGYDPVPSNRDRLNALGGFAQASARDVIDRARLVLLVLPDTTALADTIADIEDGLAADHVLAEMGTLPIDAKEAARLRVEAQGAAFLDTPVSGTGAQAENADLVVYVSGDEAAAARIRPVFEAIGRSIRPVGAFGNGMKLKFIANLLVSIHNLATAEALLMADRSGLDLQMVYEAIASGGAATSRMFEVRAPMMIAGAYEPATMKMDVYMKDVSLIMDHAKNLKCPVPLMAATVPYYAAALAQGRDKQDTAALYAVLQQLSAPVS
jgi:L-threonate 2-dehydrogenase